MKTATLARAAVIALALCLAVTACGRKGDPEPPPGSKSEYPRQYPR